jgi:hypothetical protein
VEFISETNDNSVAILLTYGTSPRPLGRRRRGEGEEEYMVSGIYTRP